MQRSGFECHFPREEVKQIVRPTHTANGEHHLQVSLDSDSDSRLRFQNQIQTQIWLDNGLCSKRRYFQFASKCLYFMLFTCLSLYCGTTRSKNIFLIRFT